MQIQTFDPNLLAKTLLDRWTSSEGPISLGIPGGRSPGRLLTPLAKLLDESILQRLHLFWVDERCVPIGHEDRNDQPTLAAWEEGGPLPGSVWPMPAHLEDANQACLIYQRHLDDLGFSEGLDVALLGIGPDGHFASLFPNHPMLKLENKVFAINDSPKPPPSRLSLSLPYLMLSSRIDVLVLGREKGEVLRKGVDNPGEAIPVSLLLKHPNLHLHLDPEAFEGFEPSP